MEGFTGPFTVAVTPFLPEGGIDTEAQKRFLDWQIEVGVPGIIILGTIGEFLLVSDDERTHLVEFTVSYVRGRMKVLIGSMNVDTRKAVRYAKQAEELGADGLMILPPYYYTPTWREIYKYYKAICEAVSLPIMLYNNPFTSHVDLKPWMVCELAKAFENIRYIKESSKDLSRVSRIIYESEGLVKVFGGERIVDSRLLGAVGFVDPYGNYLPEVTQLIWKLLDAGKVSEARELEHILDQMDQIIVEGHPLYGYLCYTKALAALAGKPMGEVRPPHLTMEELGDEGKQRMEKLATLVARAHEAVKAKSALIA
jgi:4-hydroxy-tetrahydrodipicolinate synthase